MNHLSRRQFLRLSGMAMSGALLAACGAPTGGGGDTASAPAQSADLNMGGTGFSPANPEQWARIPADHQAGELVKQDKWYEILGDPPAEPITVAGFMGGWGEAWIDAVIGSLQKDFPTLKIEKDFDPRIWEKMKPRLVAGEIPDWNYYVVGPWGGDWKKGVEEGIIAPANFLLDVEAYGVKDERVGTLIYEDALAAANGGLTDAQWTLPLSSSVYGLYYNADMFEKNGWPHPADVSWEEFMQVCGDIAATGVSPFTYAGKYPGYFDFGCLQSLWYKQAGEKAFCDMDNLVEGAFLNPDLQWGIEQIQQIFTNGWLYKGSEALSHTESQQVFVEGNAALIPNGSWMPNEQRATTPKEFRMKFSSIPAPAGGKGFPTAVQRDRGAAELQIGNGKNPLWGMEVMRRIYSPTVQQIFAETIGSPMPMKNVVEGIEVSAAWESAIAAIDAAEGNNIILNYGGWYPELGKKYGESQGDIWWGKVSAKDAMAMLERGAKETRDNPDVKKLTRNCTA